MGEDILCRLCAETKSRIDLLSINDDFWTKNNLDEKILRFFLIKISIDDKLPKCICSKCCEKVMITYEFNEKIQLAQETLQSILSEDDESKYNVSIGSLDVFDSVDVKKNVSHKDSVLNDSQIESNVENMTNDVEDATNDIDSSDFSESKEDLVEATRAEANLLEATKRKYKSRKKKKEMESPEQEVTESDDDNLAYYFSVDNIELNEDGSLNFGDEYEPPESWANYPWLCSDCDEKPLTIIALRNHHRTVHNQIPKYVCVECPKVYTKYYGFISHVRCHRYHLKFCCDACNKFFPNRKSLENHRSTHFDARPYVCQTCGKSFRLQGALFMHNRSHLPSEVKNKYPCDQCPKRFATKPNLKAHKRIHTGVRNYTCDQCGKSFIQKGNLGNHLLTHTANRPYSCEQCGKSFKTSMRLKKHESVHSGLKPHQCDVCGRQFRERGTLKEHHRIHTGAMPFTCEFCGKCFRFKGVLTTHRRQHTGERPYSCQECQHHFTNWPNYNKHMKRRHGINTSVTTRKPQTIPPTGMPNRNPPGTVIAPTSGILIVQDTNTIPNTTTYIEPDQTSYITQTTMINQSRERGHPVAMVTNNLTNQIVNMQPAHLAQSYYMPSIGLYDIQSLAPTEILHTQQAR